MSVSGRVHCEYYLFYIQCLDVGQPLAAGGSFEALVQVGDGGAWIRTGVWGGPVNVTVERCSSRPTMDVNSWEEAVEVSLSATVGAMHVGQANEQWQLEMPVVVAEKGTTVRLRVHARGRGSKHYDGAVFEPVEDYLIQVWPAPDTPGVVLKAATEGPFSIGDSSRPPA